MVKIRVVLAASQPILIDGMNRILSGEEDIQVVECVSSLEGLLEYVERCVADVLIVQRELISGSREIVPELAHRLPRTKLVVHVTSVERVEHLELYRSGAVGVFPRSITPELFVKCIRRVSVGETWIDNASTVRIIDALRA